MQINLNMETFEFLFALSHSSVHFMILLLINLIWLPWHFERPVKLLIEELVSRTIRLRLWIVLRRRWPLWRGLGGSHSSIGVILILLG